MAQKNDFTTCVKSMWTKPLENETNAPLKRIIHGQNIKFSKAVDGIRIGIKLGLGYFKCGSCPTPCDWVEDFIVYALIQGQPRKILHETGIPKPTEDAVHWFSINERAQSYMLQVRKSGVDGWWPCFNLAQTGFIVEKIGELEKSIRPQRRLHNVVCQPDIKALQAEGISVFETSVSIGYRSDFYSIGFRKKSAGLDFLAVDGTGEGRVYENLLSLEPMLFSICNYQVQGPVINPGDGLVSCDYLNYRVNGITEISGNTLKYKLCHEETGNEIELVFTMKRDCVRLDITRNNKSAITLLDSSVFQIAFSSKRIPLTALGRVIKKGETGAIALPLTLHLPGHSNIYVEGSDSICGRFDSIRPNFINTFGFEFANALGDDGCYTLPKGHSSGSVTMTFGYREHIKLLPNTPPHIREVVRRFAYTCLPFRADINSFSNNGNSMGCPTCWDVWSALCACIGNSAFDVNPFDYFKETIELYLLGAPAYAAGLHHLGQHLYEDEYIMTGTSALLGIARFLEASDSKEWYERFEPQIIQKIDEMKRRDVDGDGIVESTIRRGVSGEHQWSTCWYDVISYGYKDAFSNGLLYEALNILSKKLAEWSKNSLSSELAKWAEKIRMAYYDTFITQNGWLAGWKCADGRLHDYGFLAVNGVAVWSGLVEGEKATSIMTKLLCALKDSGFDSYDMGLPGNVYDIDDSQMAEIQHSLPFGGYQNGGITLSQARLFINGLYKANMVSDADHILSEMCKGLLLGAVYGGVGSGVDWKTWDGLPSGYEGLLCDQLGIFEPLLKRYKDDIRTT